MLGKGLESLIPPQKKQANSGDGDSLTSAPKIGGEINGEAAPLLLETAFHATAESGFVHEEKIPAESAKPADGPPEKNFGKPVEEDLIFHLEVAKIKPNPSQPRRNFDENGIRDLARSVREFGFLQPLVVSKIGRETPGGFAVEYQLIAGERRLMAAKMLGLEAVPAIIRNVDMEREKLELAVIENIQREALGPIETARAFSRLQDEFRMTQREISAKLGKSREAVANTIRLLDLPADIQDALEKGRLTESHGRLLLAIQDPGAQKKLFEDILQNRLTTRELKSRIQTEKSRKPHIAEAQSPEVKIMEERLSSELGTPVKIERGINNGKIVITFYSEEELTSIVQRIGKEDPF